MTDALLRLAWALPLVLGIGVAAAFVLKRFVVPGGGTAAPKGQRLNLRESLAISEGTRLHLLEVDGRTHLVIESDRQTLLQLAAPTPTSPVPGPFVPRWAHRFYKNEQR